MSSHASTNTRWCWGLRSEGFRPLAPLEIEQVRREVRRALYRFWVPAALVVASPAALLASFVVHGDALEPSWPRQLGLFVLMFSGLLILPSVALLVLRDTVNNWRYLRRDLRQGIVEHFTAIPDAVVATDDEDTAPPLALEEGLRSLAVLPHSRVVFLANGTRPASRYITDVYESAPQPEAAVVYAPASEVTADISPTATNLSIIGRRRLDMVELNELQKHVQRLRRIPLTLLGFIAWSLLPANMAIVTYRNNTFTSWLQEYGLPSAFIAGMTVLLSIQYVRTLYSTRSLQRDCEVGWVTVLQDKISGQERVEVLSNSKAFWSVRGVPAEWRLEKTSPFDTGEL